MGKGSGDIQILIYWQGDVGAKINDCCHVCGRRTAVCFCAERITKQP